MASYHFIRCSNCDAANQRNASFCSTCGHVLPQSTTTIPLSSDEDDLPPVLLSQSTSLLKDRYRIIDQLGTGGMGSVYQAEDTLFNSRPVAIKEIKHFGLNPQQRAKSAEDIKKGGALILRGSTFYHG